MKLGCVSATLLVVLAACGSSAAGTTAGKTAGTTGATPSAGTTGGTPSAGTTSGPAPATRPPACGPQQARTLAHSAQARVYVAHRVVYGCSVPAGRSFRLGTYGPLGRTHVSAVAVAGRVAAYGVTAFGVDTGRTSVLVRRLGDGRLLASFSATNVGLVESFGSVGSIVVKPDGAVAWIGASSSIVGRGRAVEVFEAGPSASEPTRLDSGTRIAPASLQLAGSTLTWRHGTVTRHATLR